ncbi:hypothetical protein [Emticicia sp. TH156]|uniref:hypothetical protein n=1 Tax=Emticicia sp. TH156 TaxID=2067454 RepID=UPI000C78CE9A|nr:hypothetical protein [Emticicia sp. TH156]PLK44006.1 hypothetical protein C0V77_12705 [Emticicia sp. TH156]
MWYHKSNNQWKIFFDYHNCQGGQICILGELRKVTFVKKVAIRGTTIYNFFLKPINSKQSHKSSYFLDLKKGVVFIKSSSGKVLIRTDYLNVKLTNDEVSLL